MYEGWFDEAVLAPGVTGHADWGGKRSDAATAAASPLVPFLPLVRVVQSADM